MAQKVLRFRREIEMILNGKKQRSHFDLASDPLVLMFVSMAYNAARGNLSLTERERLSLAPYRRFICQLGHCRSTIKDKRILLNKNCKHSLEAINRLYRIILIKISNKSLK